MQKAFSLTQIAVILVVVGIMMVLVEKGGDFFKTSKIQTILKDFENYDTAFQTFYANYGALPGDFSGAAGVLNGAVDGDGDGQLEFLSDGLGVWQHLANAGIYENELVNNKKVLVGVSVPESQVYDAGISAVYCEEGIVVSNDSTDCGANFLQTGNYLVLGANYNGSDFDKYNKTPVLPPQDAFKIDNKIDDGVPNSGVLQATADRDCRINPALIGSQEYLRINTKKACALYYRIR